MEAQVDAISVAHVLYMTDVSHEIIFAYIYLCIIHTHIFTSLHVC